MGDVSPAPRDASPVIAADDRLDSWKEIAAYLKRDVSTVQRWEKKEGLPVHRLPHDKLGSVFAFKPELDAWWNRGRQRLEAAEAATPGRKTATLGEWWASVRTALHTSVVAFRASWRRVVGIGVAVLAVFAAGAVFMWRIDRFMSSEPSAAQPVHLAIPLPPGTTLAVEGDTDPAIAISPDGTTIAYVVRRGPTTQIYVRRLDRAEAEPVPGTEDARSPFFSPDGKSLGFLTGSRLKRATLATGAVLTLCETAYMRGAAWGGNDAIVFARDLASDLWRVSARGGPCEPLTSRTGSEHSHRLPAFLPGGDRFLFTVGAPEMDTWNDARTDLATLSTGQRRQIFEGGTTPRYSPTGHLLYSRRASLFAVPFDLDRAQAVGRPIEVMSGLMMSPIGGEAHYALSETGVLAYAAGIQWGSQDRIVWVDREGIVEPIGEHRDSFARVQLSPDGRYLACEIDRLRIDVWVYDLNRGTMTRLTSEGLLNTMPVWTPDGRRITYTTDAVLQGRLDSGSRAAFIVWRPSDGRAPLEPLTVVEGKGSYGPWSWSPDGQILALGTSSPRSGYDIMILRRGSRNVEPLLTGPFNELAPTISPDGRWLAHVSDESGRLEVYVRPFPSLGGRWQISTNGGRFPRWAKTTGELFYREGHKMMVVDVGTSPDFSAGRPRILFENAAMANAFDVAADGQRFVMIDTSANPKPTQIDVIVNWFEELKRKVPVSGR
jgi:serine/threonine-protein kinase